MTSHGQIVPVKGSWVRLQGQKDPGIVRNHRRCDAHTQILVRWLKDGGEKWIDLKHLRSGFQLRMDVQDVPRSRTRKPLGEGVVLESRTLGGRDQVLVEFPASGHRVWLPYENVRQIRGAAHRFLLHKTGDEHDAERFRLKSLAYALELWNENTGSLSRLEIDPLPHQIHLVHHILASGNLNWLIADDVGLGKTIEVGMLLAALQHRGNFRRILMVTPAGLVRQWQEELHHKFGFDEFQIYGDDFKINNPRHWKLHDHVIASMDRLKAEPHIDLLMEAGDWDLIVFDEAHRLSRRQYGRRYEAAQRFKLAAELRGTTDAMLLLSGTPHQGMQDKFQALLELLRPEFKEEIRNLAFNPEILRDMVIRNHKADVTDANGEFIFRGKTTRTVQVSVSDDARDFDHALRNYLAQGYGAAENKGGTQGRAIGFVMTTYRKLAASSSAAIERALMRRRQRLVERARGSMDDPDQLDERDSRFSGEWEESFDASADEFFAGELAMVDELIVRAQVVMAADQKLTTFIEDLIPGALQLENVNRILVFTEYRATQDWLAAALRALYGPDSVELINGSQNYVEREKAIARFEESATFLISTEAGGEGLNLHRNCWVMVNFDLPWNPMRLVQRVGRLYRYGQKERVVVFNMHTRHTLDAQIMGLLYARIQRVVEDLAPVGVEFRAGLEDEILGELADVLDVDQVLKEAMLTGIQRTKERIDEALEKAKQAVDLQRELFEHATGFDPEEARGDLRIDERHVRAFVEAMLARLGIEVLDRLHQDRVLELRISEDIRQALHSRKERFRITFDRDLAARLRDTEMMDFGSPFFAHLVEYAQSHDFDGLTACLTGLDGRAMITAVLRWQNDQGARMRQEYTAVGVSDGGQSSANPESFGEWLLQPATAGNSGGDIELGKCLLKAAKKAMDERLGTVSNLDLHPENRQIVNGGWCQP